MSVAGLPRIGLLGCGWIAGNRLRQIFPDSLAHVSVVADTDPAAIATVREWAPEARAAEGPGDPEWENLDGVMISTPSALHGPQAAALLDRGLPVFVQKPMGVCADQVARVFEVAAARNLPVETDLCYRHLESAVAVRDALRRSVIGRPFRVEGCFHNAYRPGASWSSDPGLAGGGALMDLGIHLLDLVMWLTDSPLYLRNVSLLSRGRPWAEGEVEDFAALDLEMDDDVQVRLASSWDASTGRDAQIQLRLYGEHGSLEIGNRDGSFFDFDARLCRGAHAEPIAADDGDAWQAGPLRHWLGRIRSGAGYDDLPWVKESMALIDQAYGLARRAGAPSAPAPSPYTHSVEKEFCYERVANRSRGFRREPPVRSPDRRRPPRNGG